LFSEKLRSALKAGWSFLCPFFKYGSAALPSIHSLRLI